MNHSPRFPTTSWGLVRAAKDQERLDHLEVLNRFVAAYWRPVFYFIRARGYELHRAEDLTQEFFLQFLQNRWIRPATPDRGRFRTFLLKVLSRFLADHSPARSGRQNAFDARMVVVSTLMGDDDRRFEPCSGETPEAIFMKQWARAVIANSQRRLQAWCENRGRPDWYQLFSEAHCPPPGARRTSQQKMAQGAGITRDQVRYALEKTNEQFVVLFREEVADQVGSMADIDAEIDELKGLL